MKITDKTRFAEWWNDFKGTITRELCKRDIELDSIDLEFMECSARAAFCAGLISACAIAKKEIAEPHSEPSDILKEISKRAREFLP